MKKYLISIENNESQRLKVFFDQQIFNSSRNEFKKFGVKGIDLTVKEYFELAVAGHAKALTPGELGCTLSHLEALRDFLKTTEKYAIIFEDDAIQDGNFSFDDIENNLEHLGLENCFFFSLGGIQLVHSQKVKGTFYSKPMLERNILKVHPYYYHKFVSAYAYIVDRKMAELLLRYHSTPQVFDHWVGVACFEPNINLYATYLFDHPPVNPTETASYLEMERIQNSRVLNLNHDPHKFYQPLLKLLAKLSLKSYRVKS